MPVGTTGDRPKTYQYKEIGPAQDHEMETLPKVAVKGSSELTSFAIHG